MADWVSVYMGVSKNQGSLFGGSYSKDLVFGAV